MKIKILLFPLIILIVFYLAVAHIFPDWQRTKELKTEIEGNELVMESIKKQQSNVEGLSAQISSDSQRRDDLNEIVPQIRSEETIINAAHQLAQKYQVALLQMTFGDEKKKTTRSSGNSLTEAPVYAESDNAQIAVSVSGPYNNTKEFLDNFTRIMRANTPDSISMTRNTESPEGEESAGLEDQLDTEVTYNYPFLEVVTLHDSDMKTLQHPVQSTQNYDMTPIDQWIEMTNENVNDLQLGEHGRGSSPFMP